MLLGIDTSNYTTSAAAYDLDNDIMYHNHRLIQVPEGQAGARQSDVLFQHVKRLPEILDGLYTQLPPDICWTGVGVSTTPRRVEGSYMPCFLAGEAVASALAGALRVPLFAVSHQEGHIAAGLWSASRFDLAGAPFLTWHLSGGTTELLLVEPDNESLFRVSRIGGTSDLTAGQLIDRVGHSVGLPFPAGPALEKLAAGADGIHAPMASVRGLEGSFSGLQNKASTMADNPTEMALFIFGSIAKTLAEITQTALRQHQNLPLLCVGGVFCNKMLRQIFSRFGALFAQPEYSSDNAAGVAILTAKRVSGWRKP